MFGYIKINKEDEGELLVKELNIYKTVYCTLCKVLGKSFGVVSRLTLSYDCVFLAILMIGLKSDSAMLAKTQRCVVNKFKKCHFCTSFEDEFKFVSAVSIILSRFKIVDDIKDSKNFFKKFCSYFLLIIFELPYKRAKKLHCDVDKIVEDKIKKQNLIENSNCTIDESSDSTAQMFSFIFSKLSTDESQKRVLNRFGFFLGKWIYLIDAVDDFKKDFKGGNFNPFIVKFGGDFDKAKEYSAGVLNQVLYQLFVAYSLLEIKNLNGLLDNIVKLSLKRTQNKIFNEPQNERNESSFFLKFKKSRKIQRVILEKGENK
ncbi:MAG: DUF5685 family protein [Oscillospiraceae bacterium]|nr:DUF5685 family protein [Oscillospiraceae bacterium]